MYKGSGKPGNILGDQCMKNSAFCLSFNLSPNVTLPCNHTDQLCQQSRWVGGSTATNRLCLIPVQSKRSCFGQFCLHRRAAQVDGWAPPPEPQGGPAASTQLQFHLVLIRHCMKQLKAIKCMKVDLSMPRSMHCVRVLFVCSVLFWNTSQTAERGLEKASST